MKPKVKAKSPPKPPAHKWWIVIADERRAVWGSEADMRALAERLGARLRPVDPKNPKHLRRIERAMVRWFEDDGTRPPYSDRLDATEAARKMGVVLKPGAPCAGKGCPNRKNQGPFIGDLCLACHKRASLPPPPAPAKPTKKVKAKR